MVVAFVNILSPRSVLPASLVTVDWLGGPTAVNLVILDTPPG